MRILVTGLHRSGTSATARLLAAVTERSLLDDPQWAIFHPRMAGAYREVEAYRRELETHDIVKCPRMGEGLEDVLDDFRDARVVYLVRDPRDVYCSIAEAQASPDPTVSTMAENSRFGPHDDLWEGVALAYRSYAQKALVASHRFRNRLVFLAYQDLCNSPTATVDGLCGALGLAPRRPLPEDLPHQQLAPLRNKTPSDTSIKGVGRWVRELDSATAANMMDLCGDQFAALLARSLDLDERLSSPSAKCI